MLHHSHFQHAHKHHFIESHVTAGGFLDGLGIGLGGQNPFFNVWRAACYNISEDVSWIITRQWHNLDWVVSSANCESIWKGSVWVLGRKCVCHRTALRRLARPLMVLLLDVSLCSFPPGTTSWHTLSQHHPITPPRHHHRHHRHVSFFFTHACVFTAPLQELRRHPDPFAESDDQKQDDALKSLCEDDTLASYSPNEIFDMIKQYKAKWVRLTRILSRVVDVVWLQRQFGRAVSRNPKDDHTQ